MTLNRRGFFKNSAAGIGGTVLCGVATARAASGGMPNLNTPDDQKKKLLTQAANLIRNQ